MCKSLYLFTSQGCEHRFFKHVSIVILVICVLCTSVCLLGFLLQRIAPDPLFMTTFGRNIRTTCCQLLAGLSTIVAPFRSIASWCVEECATPTVSPWRRHAVNQVVLIQSLSPFSVIQTYVDKERFPWCYLTLVHVPLVMHDCICVPFCCCCSSSSSYFVCVYH